MSMGYMRNPMTDILVIGGGAAGCMAALSASGEGARVTLLERNPKLGRKLYITGKGRCNLTNASPVRNCLENIPGNPRFLTSAMTAFPPEEVMAYFEGLGVPLKVERGNRVFPVSDKAADVIDALLRALRKAKVEIVQDRAMALVRKEGAISGVEGESGKIYSCKAVILATGGVSYPATGSTGDGYRLAKIVGHTVKAPVGSLVPLEAGDCAPMQGLSLRNVELKVKNSRKKVVYQEQGELLFTHFGLSGPLVLSASAHLRDFEKDSYTAYIDLKPALDEETLDRRLVRELSEGANRDVRHVLETLEPKSLIPLLLERSGVEGDTKAHDVTKAQRRRLLETLKGLAFPITGPRPVEEAIVTAGGVNVKEVSPKDMSSKLCQGLFLAGEVLDVDAYTGGFNLQIAWCTGRAAGLGAAKYCLEYEKREETAMNYKSIAIDGPSGAGKSTMAKALAAELGYLYVDTGAIYRTLGVFALRNGVDPADEGRVLPLLSRAKITMGYADDGLQHMYLDGEDVTAAIRQNEVSQAASKISAIPGVRAFLLEMQRDMARKHNVIMDGRDIGTVVLPDADLKIFLTASAEARARRRCRELEQRGEKVAYETILTEIRERDARDSSRAAAPLKQAEDAIGVDTTELSLEESVAALLALVKEKLA